MTVTAAHKNGLKVGNSSWCHKEIDDINQWSVGGECCGPMKSSKDFYTNGKHAHRFKPLGCFALCEQQHLLFLQAGLLKNASRLWFLHTIFQRQAPQLEVAYILGTVSSRFPNSQKEVSRRAIGKLGRAQNECLHVVSP